MEHYEGEPERYQVPLAFAEGEAADKVLERLPNAGIARLRNGGLSGLVYDAIGEPEFCTALLDSMSRDASFNGERGQVFASKTAAFDEIRGDPSVPLETTLLRTVQSNTSVVFEQRMILKFFRRIDAGINPDLEIGRFLARLGSDTHVPPLVGALEYRRGRGEPTTLALLQKFIPNKGTAWERALDALSPFYEQSRLIEEEGSLVLPRLSLLGFAESEIPAKASELIGPFLDKARLLGRLTAQLHHALASDSENPDFLPEPFTTLYQRSMYQSMRGRAGRVLRLLRRNLSDLPEAVGKTAEAVLDQEEDIIARFRSVLERKISSTRIRCHGDYHLGQVLDTGDDFVIIDFEGESFRFLSERRLKHSPLRDLVSMLLSFDYAAYAALAAHGETNQNAANPSLEPWARYWYSWTGAAFLKSYLDEAAGAVLPAKDA